MMLFLRTTCGDKIHQTAPEDGKLCSNLAESHRLFGEVVTQCLRPDMTVPQDLWGANRSACNDKSLEEINTWFRPWGTRRRITLANTTTSLLDLKSRSSATLTRRGSNPAKTAVTRVSSRMVNLSLRITSPSTVLDPDQVTY